MREIFVFERGELHICFHLATIHRFVSNSITVVYSCCTDETTIEELVKVVLAISRSPAITVLFVFGSSASADELPPLFSS
mmetsp:Transcript_7058/g.14567  ORF Transcript_7058/g.14567 Transcript_7058/m.14567 type:complete len:80 (-) Transcript_7058:1498-1737(-)